MARSLNMIAFPIVNPAWSKLTGATQPRKCDVNRLHSVQGQPIVPTNSNQFAPTQNSSDANLKIQKVNIQVVTLYRNIS